MVASPASTPGRTDLDLTDNGRAQAVAAGPSLADLHLDDPKVISSPRRRAVETAELAGLTVDEKSELLAEWDYGSYEGLTTAEIHKSHPDLVDLDARRSRTANPWRKSASARTGPSPGVGADGDA